MTLAEFTKIVEEAYESDQLKFHTTSAAFLDDSIDFNRDAGGAIILEKSASTTSANLLTDRNLRSAMQEDATHLVERFTTSYKEQNEENTPIQQMVEMFEYLVVEEQHTILGVSPDALKKIFDLLRDKIVEVKVEYDELDLQKEQFKEIHLLRQFCQELESDKERLQTFETSFLEAQTEIKSLEVKLSLARTEMEKLLPLR